MKHNNPIIEWDELLGQLKLCLTKEDHTKLKATYDRGWIEEFWTDVAGDTLKDDITFLIDFFTSWLELPGYELTGISLRTFYSIDYPNYELVFKLTNKLFEVMVDEKTKERIPARNPTIRRFYISFNSDSWLENRVETIRLAVQVIQLSCIR